MMFVQRSALGIVLGVLAVLSSCGTAALAVNSTLSTADDVPLLPTDCIRNETLPDGHEVCVKEVRVLSWSCVGCVTGSAIGGFILFAVGLSCFLNCLGFRSIGPRGGSAASNFQRMFGTPELFREAQSSSMTGQFSMCWRATLGLVGAGLMGWAGVYLPPCFSEVQVPY